MECCATCRDLCGRVWSVSLSESVFLIILTRGYGINRLNNHVFLSRRATNSALLRRDITRDLLTVLVPTFTEDTIIINEDIRHGCVQATTSRGLL